MDFRIFSIDGSHTKEATYIDLTNVSMIMDEYGIIIVDDYLNLTWPGVRAGTDKFLSKNDKWRCIYIGYNKLFLCKSSKYDIYWKEFVNADHEILNKASQAYCSKIKDAAHFEKRMKMAGVWK